MANEQKIKEKIMKTLEQEGVELRYSFIVFVENDKLKFVSHTNKGELHTVVGMLERAKAQLLRKVEEMNP